VPVNTAARPLNAAVRRCWRFLIVLALLATPLTAAATSARFADDSGWPDVPVTASGPFAPGCPPSVPQARAECAGTGCPAAAGDVARSLDRSEQRSIPAAVPPVRGTARRTAPVVDAASLPAPTGVEDPTRGPPTR